MEGYRPGVAVAAGRYMARWNDLDFHINSSMLNIQPGDDLNVFINFESILRNLTLQARLTTNLVQYKQQIVIELESAILNLVAHYRLLFAKKMKCNTRIYYYYTDLLSDEPQQMTCINKYYRSYYRNRYLQNPEFREMGKVLTGIIIPEIELIISYVPGVYFLKSKAFDSSIIPQAISTLSGAKNVIVTGDIFDTLYLFNPDFLTLYIKNRYSYFKICSTVDSTVQSIIKNESPFDLGIFKSEMYFRLLLSIRGSKVRNIKASKGFGYGTFLHLIKNGMDRDIILKDFASLESIIQLFPEEIRSDIKKAFQCLSIDTQFDMMSEADISSLKDQIVDRVDFMSLQALNNKRFYDFPVNLSALIG